MWIVAGLWVLSMVAGCSWSRWWTLVCSATTLIAAVTVDPSALSHWTGWLQAGVLVLTPFAPVAIRARYQRNLGALQAEEAKHMVRLSEAARSLLSLQTASRQLEAQIAHITDVYHVTKETARALRFSELFTASLGIAPRLLNAKGLRLIELANGSPAVLRAIRATDGRMVPEEEHNGLLEMEAAILQRVTDSPQPGSATVQELAPSQSGSAQAARESDVTWRVAWAPLRRERQAIGVLVADQLPEEQLPTLAIMANQLSLQLSRIYLYQQVEVLAVTDALTGLFVRRHFLERAKEEIARSHRHGLSCTLLMTDLDEFKAKNDAYGHLVGDAILKDVSQLLARNLRAIDLIARYGGEEFVILLVETTAEQAIPVAQRLRQLVEVHPVRAYDEVVHQTISLGLASFSQDGATLEEVIERADQALYAAKRAGRNRVMCASQLGRPKSSRPSPPKAGGPSGKRAAGSA